MDKLFHRTAASKLQSVQDFFTDDVARLKQRLTAIEKEVAEDAVPKRNDAIHQQVKLAFEDSQTACREFEQKHKDDPQLIKDVQEGFRLETDPWFKKSWIANRARTKPSGFAGDFEMLVKLYERETPARGLGAYLDLCISDLPLAQAVRARMVSARSFLLDEIGARQDHVRVLDIACGPCREFLDWPVAEEKTLEVVAMDNDTIALDFVKQHVATQLPDGTSIEPVRYNALRTRSAEKTIKQFGRFDIIYSVGLCDYLTDEHLIKMLNAWQQTLTDDGVLLIAFKDCEQYDHTPYQWHLDWFFYQRTVQDVLDLYEKAGIDTNAMTLTRDTTGIITNYISRQKSQSAIRIDKASDVPAPMHTRHEQRQQDEV